jgi:O-acetyl-ADP-ribose deacetylase (regulator of RNase III)
MIGTIRTPEREAIMEFTTGDILDARTEALVNTVNCVGIMGRGIALQFKNNFPGNFKAYHTACMHHEVQPGRMFVYPTGMMNGPKFIINFPTKRHWRGKSRIADIESGLVALRHEIESRKIRSIAIPPLGAGLGGLDWNDVRPKIERALQGLDDVRIVVYEPGQSTQERITTATPKAPEMTAGRAALVALIERYLGGLLDPIITLLEIHKLMYFLQETGEPLRLRFVKAQYGPYAENLRHVLKAVEGYYIAGYADGGDSPRKELRIVPGAIEDARRELERDAATSDRIARVASLVDGFESPFGLELLATAHWIATHETVKNEEDLIRFTYGWGESKRQFTPRQIKLVYRMLVEKNWLRIA